MLRRLLPAAATACAFLTFPNGSFGDETFKNNRELTLTQTAPDWPLNDNINMEEHRKNSANSSAWMEFFLDDSHDLEEESSSSDGPEEISGPGKLEIEWVIGDKRPVALRSMRGLKLIMIAMLVSLIFVLTQHFFSDDGPTHSDLSGMGGVVLEDTANVGNEEQSQP